jgi:hypothetical protein
MQETLLKTLVVFARFVGERRKGRGKSGGVRVMYFTRLHFGEIWMLLIYAKSAVDSIPGHVLKALREEMENVD